ncbi:phosphatase PAP2 family protein [Flavobacterium amniphilum]|uniref:phosphatase PAP2 family protein n=1 Tax=Flavobacterium amniphilum TaxID=1834035 RepID=UPI00202A0003|nr:phosphatase PAP2 family protein [Flavobacterium amniphilum]MCL9805637.1 phosphatase PAP2 family protein [Flavobacterium amniphilum]
MFKSVCIFLLVTVSLKAQDVFKKDTLVLKDKTEKVKFDCKPLIIPSVLIGYGVMGLESHQILHYNTELRDEVKESIDEKLTIDDFSQYTPAASVYALNAFGIKGKNNFRDRTIIMGTSYLILSVSVLGLKSISKVERPDFSARNSFPSGHTATAFAGAEFLWQEYKDKSVWYGIAGYVVATGTGLFRIYNNRHWLTDVAAGAGIGILSTKIAYWLYPSINEKVFGSKRKKGTTVSVIPFYNGNQIGLSIGKTF